MSGCRPILIRVLPRLGPRARGIQIALFAALVLLMTATLAVAALPSAGLDRGFGRLYDLDFTGAQRDFESLEPGSDAFTFAMKVTIMPLRAAISLTTVLKSAARNGM